MVNCAITHRPVRHGLNGSLNYFLETVSNYPTLAECYKVAALDAYNKLSL